MSPGQNHILAPFSDKNTTITAPSIQSKNPIYSKPYQGTSIQKATNGNVAGTPIKISNNSRMPRQLTHLGPVLFHRPQLTTSSQEKS